MRSPQQLPCFRFLFFLIFSFFLVSGWGVYTVFAQNLIEINADSQLAYANHFFKTQDYPAAVAEYKKFSYFFPDDKRILRVVYKIGMSYYLDKSYIKALNQFTQILDQNGLIETGISSAFMISRCYQAVRNYSAAIDNLIYLKKMTTDPDLADKIYYQLGWLYLESGNFSLSRTFFSKISLTNQYFYHTDTLKTDLKKYDDIPQKKPIIAGIFSIIPGGGYLYCGRYQDALTAFIINGAFIYGAYESFDHDLYAIGGMMSALGLGFYTGNIYGGISSAHKFNQKKQNEFVRYLKKKFYQKDNLSLSLKFKSDDILLGMGVHF